VAYNGVAGGFSSLTSGSTYYANGDGSITTTPTGNRVGLAISSTQILLNNSVVQGGSQFFGDMIFANNFKITEEGNGGQGIYFKNQLDRRIATLDDGGNFTVTGKVQAEVAQLNQVMVAGDGSYAQQFVSSNLNLQAGTIVALDNANAGQIVAESKTYDPGVVGIISTNPSIVVGNDQATNAGVTQAYAVATDGRTSVFVTDENGVVKNGDFLTSSLSIPGYAMKASHSGIIVGRALQDFDSSTATKATINSLTINSNQIAVLVHISWQNINNTYVMGGEDPIAAATTSQSTTQTSGLTSTDSSLTYVIRQNIPQSTSTAASGTAVTSASASSTATAPANPTLADILQLQSNGATRFMVASNGATTINAAVSDQNQIVFVIKNNGSEQLTINAKGDAILGASLIVKKDIAALGTVLGSTSILARNVDSSAIHQGDLVMLKGVETNAVVGSNPILSVVKAFASQNGATADAVVIGIADRNLSDFDIPGAPVSQASYVNTIPTQEYMNVVTSGTFAVINVDTATGSVAVGDKLTLSSNAGFARKLNAADTGMPVLGIALDPVATGVGKARVYLTISSFASSGASASSTAGSVSNNSSSANSPSASAAVFGTNSSAAQAQQAQAAPQNPAVAGASTSTPSSAGAAAMTPGTAMPFAPTATPSSTTPTTPTTPVASTPTISQPDAAAQSSDATSSSASSSNSSSSQPVTVSQPQSQSSLPVTASTPDSASTSATSTSTSDSSTTASPASGS
jgi:hypothetical protein